MEWPKISVVVPSFNQGRFIGRTIRSIQKQDYAGQQEIIVSDGGSSDETVEVLKSFPDVRWWSEKDRGFADAVNKGLKVATGEIIAIQSSDDYYLQGAFRDAARELGRHSSCVMVSGGEVRINTRSEIVHVQAQVDQCMSSPQGMLQWGNYLPQHTTFMRREALERLGGLREAVDWCADFDLFYRLLHLGSAVCTSVLYGVYQLHDEQRTQKHPERWVEAHLRSIEDAETNPPPGSTFRPTPAVREQFEVNLTLHWYEQIGGEPGLQYAKQYALEAVEGRFGWQPPARNTAKLWLRKRGVMPGLHPAICQVLLQLRRIRLALRNLVRPWAKRMMLARKQRDTTKFAKSRLSVGETFWC